jgi:hypothetical protein
MALAVHPRNGWFPAYEFLKVATAMHHAATEQHVHWLDEGFLCKYVSIYVDQRTGDFILRDYNNEKLTLEQVYKLFPVLRD